MRVGWYGESRWAVGGRACISKVLGVLAMDMPWGSG